MYRISQRGDVRVELQLGMWAQTLYSILLTSPDCDERLLNGTVIFGSREVTHCNCIDVETGL